MGTEMRTILTLEERVWLQSSKRTFRDDENVKCIDLRVS